MSNDVAVDEAFLRPFESMARALEMAEVPLLFLSGVDLARFAEQTSAPLGATVIYSSQPDFEAQMLASLPHFDYLFVIVEQPLTRPLFHLLHAYLAARDVMCADYSPLAKLGVEPPAAEHRLVLLTDRATFAAHDAASQRTIQELCTCIAVS